MRAATIALLGLLLGASAHAGERDTFAILSEDATETSRVVAVRIGHRLAGDDLVRLANVVKEAKSSPTLRNTVVSFYLPTMPQNQRPWASVDLAPTPKVYIAGLQLAEERAFIAEANADRRSVTGAWLTELPASPGRIMIFTEKGRTFLEAVTRGGQKSIEEVAETPEKRGTRIDLKSGGSDYYVLKASGELELRNEERLIAVAERIILDRHAGAAVASAADVPPTASMEPELITTSPSAPSSSILIALPSADTTLANVEAVVAPTETQAPVATSAPSARKKRVVRRVPVRRGSETVVLDVMNIRYQR